MGLIEEELKEIRRDIKHFRAGKLKDEEVYTLIALYSQTEKRMRLMLQAMGMAAKHGKKHLNQMIKTNLVGNGTVIDLSIEEIEEEKVLCPVQDRHITRSECLDFSGNSENYESCKNCDTGIENKKLLIGETPMYTT